MPGVFALPRKRRTAIRDRGQGGRGRGRGQGGRGAGGRGQGGRGQGGRGAGGQGGRGAGGQGAGGQGQGAGGRGQGAGGRGQGQGRGAGGRVHRVSVEGSCPNLITENLYTDIFALTAPSRQTRIKALNSESCFCPDVRPGCTHVHRTQPEAHGIHIIRLPPSRPRSTGPSSSQLWHPPARTAADIT